MPVRGRLRIALIGPLIAVALGILGLTPAVASPYPQGVVPDVDAWLDRALPKDAAAGTEIRIGATIWSSRGDGPIGSSAVFFRLYAADGGPEFSEVVAIEDWPGHFSVSATVPKGGVGELHIGTQGTACDSSGCTRSDAIYEIAGVGPPPAAPLPMIATAAIRLAAGDLVAGVPVAVEILLAARADWDPATFPGPAELHLIVREPRGPDVDRVAAPRTAPGNYAATITFPEQGEFALQVAADASGDPDSLFATSTILVTALAPEPATPGPSPTAPPTGLPNDPRGSLVPLLAAIVIALIGLGALFGLRRRRA